MAEDKNLTCRDCAKTFVFTAGEQAFFSEKGLSDPIRCPDCRRMRKQQRMADASAGPLPQDTGPRSLGTRPGGSGLRSSGGFDRAAGPPRTGDTGFRGEREPGRGSDSGDEERRNFRKARPPASVAARTGPPKKEQPAAQKEKRPGNRRNEEKLLINWKEEVGLNDTEEGDWLSSFDEEE